MSSTLNFCQIDSYQTKSINKVLSQITDATDLTAKVILDDSVLYPEGGGQPCDFGTVNGIRVLDVQKNEGKSIFVKLETSLPDYDSSKECEVECVVDWERRYDFMQQHSAQHLFSAVASKLFKAETTGWNLGEVSVSVDLDSLLTEQQIYHIEKVANEEIRKGSLISWQINSKDDIGSLENIRGAPKGAALQLSELRFVGIKDLDLNPCGGTHLKSTSEIQIIKVVQIEKDRNASRIRFLAGQRALDYFELMLKRESSLSVLLSVPPTDHCNNINKICNDKKQANQLIQSLNTEIIRTLAFNISNQIDPNDSNSFVVFHRDISDVNFLLSLADLLISFLPQTVFYLSSQENADNSGLKENNENGANSKSKKNKSKEIINFEFLKESMNINKVYNFSSGNCEGVFVLAGPKDKVDNLKSKVFEIIEGRGGGRPGRIQGTAKHLENIELVRQLLSK